MASLKYSKSKIQLAKSGYENHLRGQQDTQVGTTIKHFPKRVIMLSDTLETPTLDNLWSYLSHFHDKIEPLKKAQFTFEDLAGIYTENDVSKLFAVCISYVDIDGLKILPEGRYLCADCTEENRGYKLHELINVAKDEYHTQPEFTIQQIIVSGILQWNYQAQVYLGQ